MTSTSVAAVAPAEDDEPAEDDDEPAAAVVPPPVEHPASAARAVPPNSASARRRPTSRSIRTAGRDHGPQSRARAQSCRSGSLAWLEPDRTDPGSSLGADGAGR